ncbi:MAG: competence/damage-inducible protein A, partial [Nitrospira defluvii]|nr:competence/damage-inducible protein A [Nitrospira defluvii]
MNKPRTWTAETIAIGSELLLGGRLDTNSLFIADQLAACGVELRYKTTVGDDVSDIVAVLKTAVRRSRVVMIT